MKDQDAVCINESHSALSWAPRALQVFHPGSPAGPFSTPSPHTGVLVLQPPHLCHQGSHLKSQFLVDGKPAGHNLATGLAGKQQPLPFCFAFDLTPEVQPAGGSGAAGSQDPPEISNTDDAFSDSAFPDLHKERLTSRVSPLPGRAAHRVSSEYATSLLDLP